MSKRVAITKAGAAALAGVIALGAAAQASAQTAGPYAARSANGYYYDPCKRDATQRGTAGALIGGGMGAVIGSNAAARNARTEGAILGGLLGAIAGGMVGNKSAACAPQSHSYAAAPPPPPPPPPLESSYYDERDAWDDDYQDSSYDRRPLSDPPRTGEDCTLAESPIYLPDGTTQTRFVRVCRDATGRYAVVD